MKDETGFQELAEPVMTALGELWGRDTLFLDTVEFVPRRSLTLRGTLDGAHTSVGHGSDDIPFEFRFHAPLLVRVAELEVSGFSGRFEGRSCFLEVKRSQWLETARDEHPEAITPEYRHYVIATYDDVFEVVCKGLDIHLDVNAAR